MNEQPIDRSGLTLGGVRMSLRGLIALTVTTTVCAMSLSMIEVREPLYTLAGLIVGFYFGQDKKQ
jgi:hypothetical protein